MWFRLFEGATGTMTRVWLWLVSSQSASGCPISCLSGNVSQQTIGCWKCSVDVTGPLSRLSHNLCLFAIRDAICHICRKSQALSEEIPKERSHWRNSICGSQSRVYSQEDPEIFDPSSTSKLMMGCFYSMEYHCSCALIGSQYLSWTGFSKPANWAQTGS